MPARPRAATAPAIDAGDPAYNPAYNPASSPAVNQHRDRYGAVSRDRSLSLAVRIGDAPGAELVPGCEAFDANADGLIDLADFARLQRFLTAT